MSICDVDDCTRPRHAYGFCGMHAQRMRRTGSPLGVRRTGTVESFWLRVAKNGPGGCWLWTGTELTNGYGKIATRRTPTASGTRLAHRVSWELARGLIDEDLVLDHLCRVKLCVNPDHLEPVVLRENVRRGLHGVLRTRCKYGHELTPENTQYDVRRNCRRCRTCAREWDRRAKAKRRALRASTGASVRSMYAVAGVGVGR
jgi:hypothetical protein